MGAEDDRPSAPAGALQPNLPLDVPVLVVGGGPVGLLAAILLSGRGVGTAVVERRDGPQVPPAAHVVNARTFEICRAAGIDGDRLAAACQRSEDGAWVRWMMTSLAGEELARVPFEGQHELARDALALDHITPTPLRNLSQSRFEPILRDHVAAMDRATLHSGVEWVSAEQDEDGVTSTVRVVATGETARVRSRFLIGADGAGSPVRRWLGIGMDGPDRMASFVTIHVEGAFRPLLGDRPATLYWIDDPDRAGVFVAHDLDSTMVFMHPFDPGIETLADYPVERCAAIVRAALGPDDVAFEVRSVSPWSMTGQVASRYRDGRVFLAGDAAHRFPPTGGLGLNTGAVDAQNLAWKTAAVLEGWAGPDLLATYEAERRPVAQANAERSLFNAVKLLEVPAALGLVGDPVADRVSYAATLAREDGRAGVRAAAEGQAGHFDQLGLQLGFRHGGDDPADDDLFGGPDGAGVDGRPGGSVQDAAGVAIGRDDAATDAGAYTPTTRPGARLPHAWVSRVADGTRVSTLDLVPLDRFVLLTASETWAAAGEEVAAVGLVPLDVILFGRDVMDDQASVAGIDEVGPDGAVSAGTVGQLAGAGSWAACREMGPDGVVLVRPDQHVAWRRARGPADPAALTAALARGAALDQADARG